MKMIVEHVRLKGRSSLQFSRTNSGGLCREQKETMTMKTLKTKAILLAYAFDRQTVITLVIGALALIARGWH